MAYQISATTLTEGATVLVRGKTNFPKITRLIDGQELIDDDARRVQYGLSPVNAPHTSINILAPQVIYADPANPTREEQFVNERFFVSKKHPEVGPQYSVDSKSSTLPIIAIPDEANPGQFVQDLSGQELANEVDVTLVLEVYKPKNFNNRGLALRQVIVNETPRYYTQAVPSMDALTARGIVFSSQPVAQTAPNAAPAPGNAPAGQPAQPAPAAYQAPASDNIVLPGPGMTNATAANQPVAQAPAPVPAQVPSQAPAPVSVPAQAQAPAPAPTPAAETPEQMLARLQKENEALRSANAGAASAVGAPTAAGPWDNQQAGITYNG